MNSTSPLLQGDRISVGARVREVSVSVAPGQLTALLGPNGAGKTSLLRALLGLERCSGGTAHLNGAPVSRLHPTQRARQVAYLPQTRPLAWPNSVRDVVALGRFAWGGAMTGLSATDQNAVTQALNDCSLNHLADRRADTLSGGELARVHIARALAAQTPLLLADEPVAALDPQHQLRVMALIRRFVDRGGGALVVLHDIALAARHADQLIWMKDGALVAAGPPMQTLTPAMLTEVYGINASVNGWNIQIEGIAPDAIS